MNISVSITTGPNDKLEKTVNELAEAFMLAAGGDPEADQVNVSVMATIGTVPAPMGVPVP